MGRPDRLSGRGRTSGLDLVETQAARAARVFDSSGSKVTRLIVYVDRENAFIDLGLGPEGDSS